MSKFQELLGELEKEAAAQGELAKSMPAVTAADDATVAAAAAEPGADADKAKPEGEQDLTKSLNPEDDVVVVEVDDLIKSMGDLSQRFDENEGLMAKALGDTLNLVKTQGEMIKSLNDRVATLANQGSGRKALLVATERAQPGEHLAKSLPQQEQATIQPQEILAKCLTAQKAGKLTGNDVARAESQLNHGLQVDPAILAQLS